MADFVVGIDYLLEGDDSSDEELPKVQEKQAPPEIEKKQSPELSGMDLLRSMYKKDEEMIQRKRSYHNDHAKHKVKMKLKVGTIVDIYSTSKTQWLEGSVIEIKGDTICIMYGKKKKWLHKTSKNYRPKNVPSMNRSVTAPIQPQSYSQSYSQPQLPASESPPAAFDPVLLDNDTTTPSLSAQPPPPIAQFEAMDLNLNRDAFVPPPPESIPEAPKIMSQSAHHYEYDVTFVTQSLGLQLCAFKDGMNAMVKSCVNAFSASSVDSGSLIAAVNGKNVFGLQYQVIRDILKENAMVPPLTVTFRAKMDSGNYKQENNVNERGLLQVKVISCIELKHAANYVGIQVGNAYLTTKELKKNNHHPEWNEVLRFKNFRCDHGKKAIVNVYAKSAVLKDKKVGSISYSLPIKFNKLKKETLELKTDKGKISGILNINAIVVRQ